MNIKILPFGKIENDQIIRLFIQVFEQEPWNDKWPSFERAKAYLTDITNTPGFRGFVITHNQSIVGACFGYIMKWWQGDEYYLKEFFVDQKMQHQGFGSKLYGDMCDYLKQENIDTIILLTERNVPAYEFYCKKGFKTIDESVFMIGKIK